MSSNNSFAKLANGIKSMPIAPFDVTYSVYALYSNYGPAIVMPTVTINQSIKPAYLEASILCTI